MLKTTSGSTRHRLMSMSARRAAAILELAPANHFYAEGRKLEIDQVNLQVSQIQAWRFCIDCSYLELGGAVGATRLLPSRAAVPSGPMKDNGATCCACGK